MVKTEIKCQYCEGYFAPTKRFVQKYCSHSCRTLAYNRREIDKQAVVLLEKYEANRKVKNVATPEVKSSQEISLNRVNDFLAEVFAQHDKRTGLRRIKELYNQYQSLPNTRGSLAEILALIEKSLVYYYDKGHEAGENFKLQGVRAVKAYLESKNYL